MTINKKYMSIVRDDAIVYLNFADDYQQHAADNTDLEIVQYGFELVDKLKMLDMADNSRVLEAVFVALDQEDVVDFLTSNNEELGLSLNVQQATPAFRVPVSMSAGGKGKGKKKTRMVGGSIGLDYLIGKIVAKIIFKIPHILEHIAEGALNDKSGALFTNARDKELYAMKVERYRDVFSSFFSADNRVISETAKQLRKNLRMLLPDVKYWLPIESGLPDFANNTTYRLDMSSDKKRVKYTEGDLLFDVFLRAGVVNAAAASLDDADGTRASSFVSKLKAKMNWGSGYSLDDVNTIPSYGLQSAGRGKYESMTVAQLKERAAKLRVKVGSGTKKADIIAALRKRNSGGR